MSFVKIFASTFFILLFSMASGAKEEDYIPHMFSCEEYVKKLEKKFSYIEQMRDRYILECQVAHGKTTEKFKNISSARKSVGDNYKSLGEIHLAGQWYLSAYIFSTKFQEGSLKRSSSSMAAYELGLIEKNNSELTNAFNYFLESAGNNHNYAQYEVGLAYKNGVGTIKSYVESYAWFNVCASYSNGGRSDQAKKKIEELESLMTPSSMEKAQELSKQYYDNVYRRN